MARVKRASFKDQEYWGRPVPAFGDRGARIVIVGLAPAAHGANRTGRMFTGDRSGDWLYRALHEAGFANQAESVAAEDGLELTDVFITAANRCAPPANKPTTIERDLCRPFLDREFELLDAEGEGVRVFIALGSFGWDQAIRVLRERGCAIPKPKPKFGHLAEAQILAPASGHKGFPRNDLTLLGSYHPSQQNTFTGKLTRPMLAAVFSRAAELLD
ncbi:MAG: uracil-DNA glycosylase [Acidobacteria bacterium]|nr:uracil-DNA glycosylase [Acidobacteriota bacterium]